MKTISKGGFLGLNNRLPDFALHKKDVGDFLRKAENVDIDNSGRIRRRTADALIQAMTGAHSLYMDSETTGHLVRSSVMYRITLPTYSETLFKILAADDPVSYVPYAGSLYWSNGTDSGRIESGVNYPMALPTPSSPSVATVTGGLFAGWYQVAVAYYNHVTGEEGGVSPSSNYELAADGGLRIALPSSVTGATKINVYVSTVNGSIPLLQATVDAGTATVDVTTLAIAGREAFQRYEAPLPAGSLFLHNGTLCSFNGSSVYYGIPYRPGYYIPTEGRIPFPSPVTNAVSNQVGIYVTTTYADPENAGMTYWLAGNDLRDVQGLNDVLPYGAVKGTAFRYKHKASGDQAVERVGWFGAQGVVIGDTGGNVTAAMADNVDVTIPASGVSAIFSTNGFRRVVSCGYALNLDNLAASTYAGYDYTSISGNYGTKADGIYNLAATGDVAYVVDFGKENFGAENLKHLPAVYLGVNSNVPMQLRVQAPNDVDYTYDARSSSTDTQIQRIDPGKGLRANWFNLSLIGSSDFTLASVSFAPVASTRRI